MRSGSGDEEVSRMGKSGAGVGGGLLEDVVIQVGTRRPRKAEAVELVATTSRGSLFAVDLRRRCAVEVAMAKVLHDKA